MVEFPHSPIVLASFTFAVPIEGIRLILKGYKQSRKTHIWTRGRVVRETIRRP